MKIISYRRLWRFYPFYLEFIPITAILASFIHVFWAYPRLPEAVPLSLNMDGSVAAYGSPSLMKLLYVPLTALILYGLLTWVSYRRMAKMEDDQGQVFLPEHLRQKVSLDFLTSFQSFSVQTIFSAITFLVLASCLSSYLTIQASWSQPSLALLALPWLFYLLALVSAFLQYARIRKLKSRLRKE